jgi:16S rRNA processing protein RimM
LSKPVKFLEIGKIVKPHGLKGEMKAASYLSESRLPEAVTEVYLEGRSGERRPYRLGAIRFGRKALWLRLEGVEDITQAEGLIGSPILVPRDRWGPLPADEYFWQDLLGLTVVTEEGQTLGKISAIFPTGSNDVYICRAGEREILLPATADTVRTVDLDAGIMMVRLPEGIDEAS